MMTDQQTRNILLRKLEKVSDRWHDASTDRKRLNAARAALAFLDEAYRVHCWITARPNSSERERWENRLAVVEGRPRTLPRVGISIVWESDKPIHTTTWTA